MYTIVWYVIRQISKAPEMKKNRYGKEIDIWAAGAILCRLLTSKYLRHEATDQNGLDNWINEKLSGKSDAAKDLLKKMLKLDPKQKITAPEALGTEPEIISSSCHRPCHALVTVLIPCQSLVNTISILSQLFCSHHLDPVVATVTSRSTRGGRKRERERERQRGKAWHKPPLHVVLVELARSPPSRSRKMRRRHRGIVKL
ncbi:hypothetical protein TIFTF001_034193 [Ficus carica]|uniref:Protein kinase domain-containing protein n=1 Tax=Ficus carica TaxID=3494 RepID=A0AA88DZV0_FICCA|nr:hypothetical protein TIFTF001_034193 [Ficus carica]